MVAFPLSIVFLGSLLSPSYQQQCLPSAQSSRPCEFSEDLPESLVLEVQDTLGRATVGGSYQKVQGCFHNGAPLYSQNTIRREAGQAPRMVFPEARPTPASLYLGEGGRWRLGTSQASPASPSSECVNKITFPGTKYVVEFHSAMCDVMLMT